MLYPVVVSDLLLTAAALDLFVPIWSDTIIDEMRRNILADRPDVEPESIDRMIAAMAGRKVRPPLTAQDVAGRIGQQQGFAAVGDRLRAALRDVPDL